MPNIQRPLKTFGTRAYMSEVTAAPENRAPILSEEVDADFDLIYNAWNTGVGIGDIADGAVGNDQLGFNSVTTDKILNGTITSDDLGPDSVITSKIKNLNVTTAKIADFNVTTGKIAPGASMRRPPVTIDPTLGPLPTDKIEHVIATIPVFTPISVVIRIVASLMVTVRAYPTGGHGVYIFRIYVNQGSDIAAHVILLAPPGNVEILMLTIPLLADAIVVQNVPCNIRVTVQQVQPGGALAWDLSAGRVIVEEPS